MRLRSGGGRPSRRTPGEVRSGRPDTRHSGGLGGGARRPCARHGLAVAADGRCVLCRRDDAVAAEETERVRARAARRVVWLGLALVVCVGALFVWRTTHSLVESARQLRVAREVETDEAAPDEEPEPPEPRPPEGGATQPHTPPPWERRTAPSNMAEVATAEDADATATGTQGSPDAAPDASSDADHTPSQAELDDTLRATPITLYATEWCPICAQARAFLRANHLAWREVDVERVASGWQTVERLAGKRAVPVVVVDGEVLGSGLDQAQVMKAVVRSVERRLGVKGIELKQLAGTPRGATSASR
jgi:glutaredoxin 3